MMKDEITLNFNFNILKEQCNICFKQNHLSDECVKTHYVPDKDFLIKKNNYSAYQQRGHNKLPVKLLTKKFNVLANLSKIQSFALKKSKTIDEDLSVSDASVEEETDIQKTSIRLRNSMKPKPKLNFPILSSQRKKSSYFKMDDSPLNNSNRLSGFSNYNEEMKLNKKTTSDISLKTEEQLIIDLSMPNVI